MRKADVVYYAIVIVLLGAVVYMISIMKSETTQCVRNPFIYGAQGIKGVECSCVKYDTLNGCPARFTFNETTFKNTPQKCDTNNTFRLDFSSINLSE